MNPIRSILRRVTANMDAASEDFVRDVAPETPLHLAFVPTPAEQIEAKSRKARRVNRSGPTVVRPFNPDESPVERARNEPRSRRADQARAYRRRKAGSGNLPRLFPGPLEPSYVASAAPPRRRAAGRIVQLITLMTAAYKAGDRSGFGERVPEFDWLSDLLEGEENWGVAIRMKLFPDFVCGADLDRVG